LNNYSNNSSKILGFDDQYQRNLLILFFIISITLGFGFDDKNRQFILLGLAFNNSIAFGFDDNKSQDIFWNYLNFLIHLQAFDFHHKFFAVIIL
jgi:hypothetical protein